MDVILSGPQGGGKTQTVKSLTELYKNRTRQYNAVILELEGGTPIVEDPLVDGFVEVKPDVVIFDGCITGAKDLAAAVSAVRRYRETGREVMAIYAVQSEVVNLSKALGKTDTDFIPAELSLSDYPDGTIAKGCSGEKWVKTAGYWLDERGVRFGNLPSTWDGLVKTP
jgi:hypothetical protein